MKLWLTTFESSEGELVVLYAIGDARADAQSTVDERIRDCGGTRLGPVVLEASTEDGTLLIAGDAADDEPAQELDDDES